jgi:hypothetical protein
MEVPVPELIMVMPVIARPVSDAPVSVGAARSTQVRCCGTGGHRSFAA